MLKKIGWIVISVLLMMGLSGCLGNKEGLELTDPQPDAIEQPGEGENGADVGNGSQDDNQEPAPEPSEDPSEPSAPSDSDEADRDIPAKNRPNTKSDVISLEGMEESFSFTLYDVPALQFSTYLVDDLVAEGASSGEGDTFIIYANFAGQRNEDAKVVYFSPDAGIKTTVEEQAEEAEQSLKDEGYDILSHANPTKRFDFSEREIYFSKKNDKGHYLLGTVSVFERNNRVYRIFVQYPEDFEEGFMPRIAKVFEDTMWYAD